MATNRARARALVATGAVVPGAVAGVVLGVLVALVAGVLVAVVVAVVVAVALWRGATGIVLRRIGAPPASRGSHARLENVVEGLCATFGLRPPDLRVLDDAVPNCCSVGLDPAEATLVVTTGLLERLDLVELEAVVAHELAHIRREDIVVATVAAALFGPWCRLVGDDRWLASAAGPGRERSADEVAVTVVRYPPGLEAALETMLSGPEPAPGSLFATRRFESVRALFVDPDVGCRDRPVEGRLDATAVRAAILAEQ